MRVILTYEDGRIEPCDVTSVEVQAFDPLTLEYERDAFAIKISQQAP